MNKNGVYPYEGYYSAIKGNEVMIHSTTYMNLENMMVSERKPDTKGQMYDSIYMKFSRIGKSIARERSVIANG